VVFAGGLLGAILLTWPEPPWTALLSAGIGVMMVLPILSAPFIRLLWLAFDLCVRPVSVEDLEPAPSAAHDQIQLEAIKRLRQEEGLR